MPEEKLWFILAFEHSVMYVYQGVFVTWALPNNEQGHTYFRLSSPCWYLHSLPLR